MESCHFRDLIGEFKAVGAQPVGISSDRVERQRHFAEKHSLGYPLLSDSDQVVAGQFGVRGWSLDDSDGAEAVAADENSLGALGV